MTFLREEIWEIAVECYQWPVNIKEQEEEE